MQPTRVLRIDASLFGSAGASTEMNRLLVEALRQQYGDIDLIHRDLGAEKLPPVSAEFLQALGKQPDLRSSAEAARVALADQLIDELLKAESVVIGAPMYNFTIPASLKNWMDYVARAGVTFRYTPDGPEGLIGKKSIYINTSRGGMHKGTPSDGVAPLMLSFFQLLGATDVKVIYAEGVNMGENGREAALSSAREQIRAVAA